MWLAFIEYIGFVVIACLKGTYAQNRLNGLPTDRPLIIAHRGSSGMRPEHTVAAYQLAIEQGADVIECDLAVTKDMQLVCEHDGLNETTNVASFPEFLDRARTISVFGFTITDYFPFDFTLEELRTLRKVQRRSYRDQSFNGQFPLASFDEYVAVAQNSSNNRTIGIYPETKFPSIYNPILAPHNTTMEDLLLESLRKHGYVEETSPCLIQSFSEDSLRYMANRTKLPLVFLTSSALTDDKLAELATFCYGIGTSKQTIVEVGPNRYITRTTNFIDRAHNHSLKVHAYTFQNEDEFLAWDYGADPYREYAEFLELGVDGDFTDYPWSLSYFLETKNSASSSSASIFIFFITLIVFLGINLEP